MEMVSRTFRYIDGGCYGEAIDTFCVTRKNGVATLTGIEMQSKMPDSLTINSDELDRLLILTASQSPEVRWRNIRL